jgi:hypothetical protein
MEKEQMEELNLYVELSTSRIYEGKLFEEFVIARPLLPQFHDHIRKVEISAFSREFEDFQGNREEIRTFLKGYHVAQGAAPEGETIQ